MKKIVAILLAVCLCACVFAGCGNKGGEKETTTVAASDASKNESTTENKFKEAALTQSDAIRLIESYSSEELALSEKERKKCDFMASNSVHDIEGEQYIQIIATIKKEQKNDKGEVSYTFNNKGEYYIRFDGKKILLKDMKSGEYKEMKVKEVPTTEAPTAHAEDETEADQGN